MLQRLRTPDCCALAGRPPPWQVVLDDHCGWVRSLAIAQGRWLFSCACNTLRQWDMSRAVPRCTATVSLDKGDILALVARKDRIYAANADGSIRWVLRRGHAPCCRACQPFNADMARVHRAGYDDCGCLFGRVPHRLGATLALTRACRCTRRLHSGRAWSIGKKGELQEVACRKKAHGERVTAIALKGGLLYSGGPWEQEWGGRGWP